MKSSLTWLRGVLGVGIVAAMLVGAGCSPPTGGVCTAGAVRACACSAGVVGTQTCLADETYSTCMCASTDAGGETDAHEHDAPVTNEDVPVVGPDGAVSMDAAVPTDARLDGANPPDVRLDGAGGTEGGTPVDAGPDVVGEVATGPARELLFAVSTLTIDLSDDPTTPVAGFDVDNHWSSGESPEDCSHEDFPSVIDRDQNCAGVTGNVCPAAAANPGCTFTAGSTTCRGGVDNQMPTLANTLDTLGGGTSEDSTVRGKIRRQVVGNRGTLLVRVTGVNGDPGPGLNDPDVDVQVAAAVPAFSDMCTASASGRAYSLRRSSLRAGGSSIADALFSVHGSIVNGRLQTNPTADGGLRLDLGNSDVLVNSIAMRSTRLRATLNADGTAVQGNLGGYYLGQEIIDAVGARPEFALFRPQIAAALGGLIDVQIAGVCVGGTSAMRTYGGLSAGFGMTWVPATVGTPAVVDAPAAGSCGARP